MADTFRNSRVWDKKAYLSAVAELLKAEKIERLDKGKCPKTWKLDKHSRIINKEPPHRVLLPLDPISNSKGGWLPGLELGRDDRITQVHQELMHAGAFKVHQYLTKTLNYAISRRKVQDMLRMCTVCVRQQVRRVATPAVPVRAFWPMQRIQLDFIDCRGKHLHYPRKMQHGFWYKIENGV